MQFFLHILNVYTPTTVETVTDLLKPPVVIDRHDGCFCCDTAQMYYTLDLVNKLNRSIDGLLEDAEDVRAEEMERDIRNYNG